ncbi:hypothetical protein VB711_03310 [Cronbergia sp. UHCC 0137]|uniref:hypothetical protein n=1 Tax=Cronbergia sp. UHCC 0137 TaxID=3110239 RepID=UPI002B21C564|nr:hypothetical protein [Cronbergia sp. UHCC 0137]MEA5616871.1 hypothetical protein [Cronbergia sp. UHCC 0137]
MVESKQTFNNQSGNTERATIGRSYPGSSDINTGSVKSRTEYGQNTITGQDQPYAGSTSRNINAQVPTSQNTPTNKPESYEGSKNSDVNSALTRAIIGGIVGATLGSLAGALAGKRIGQGFNHTVRGLGDASKTLGYGLGQTAKGLGDVAKSFVEGATQAVTGGVSDTVEGANELVQGATDKAKDIAQNVTEGVRQTTVGALDVVQSAADKAKDKAQNTRLFEDQGVAANNQQINNDDINNTNQDLMRTTYISEQEQTQRPLIDSNISVTNTEESRQEEMTHWE